MNRVLTTCLLSLVLMHLTLPGQKKGKPTEYQMKAVFIANIANFVEWPQGTPKLRNPNPLIVGVIGDNPFLIKEKGDDEPTNWLEIIFIVQKREIKSKKAEIRYISDISEIPDCHILFISESEKKNLPEILAAARENQVLTLSDTDGFAKKGVHFNFVLKSGSVKYEINQKSLTESGLKPKFQLLKYAKKIVNPIKR